MKENRIAGSSTSEMAVMETLKETATISHSSRSKLANNAKASIVVCPKVITGYFSFAFATNNCLPCNL